MKVIDNKKELIEFIGIHEMSFYTKKTAPVLYHGTDTSLTKISTESREKLIKACKTIIKQLLSVYETNNFFNRINEFKDSTEDMSTIADAYACARAMQRNSPQYSYGHLYLTSQASKAISYAKRAWKCGELGYMAYFLKKGCDDFGFAQPEDMDYVAARKTFESKDNKKEPCVLIYTEVPREDIELDDGRNEIVLDKPYLYNKVRVKENSKLPYDSAAIVHKEMFDALLETDELIEKNFKEILIQIASKVYNDTK